MALSINYQDSTYFLSGRLYTNQVFQIRAFFQSKATQEEQLSIDLGGLDDVDLSAALMFKQLRDEAIQENRQIKICAGSNEKILGPFRMLQDQYVLAA